MREQPFKDAVHILEKLESEGYKSYFVGGCVRDSLLDRTISDIDIATAATPAQLIELFSDVIPVGIEHGTVIVRYQHKSYEVTTFRLDGKYSDQRHPDEVEFIKTIDEDLKRRDFTINAMAMDKEGNVLDLFGGIKDLNEKKIRTVGNGQDRFQEDPLRIIRALRFSSQLGFSIENDTLLNMKKVGSEITELAVERIRVEITKFFGGDYLNKGIDYLKSTEIYKYLPVMINYSYILNKIPSPVYPVMKFSEVIVLFHYLEPTIKIEEWLDSWKCSNQEKREVKKLIDSINYYKGNGLDEWFIYCLGSHRIDAFVRLMNNLERDTNLDKEAILIMHRCLEIKSREELQLTGHDLIELFPTKKSGPWMQMKLNEVEKKVVLKQLPNTNRELKDWIKWNPPEIN
ncbi:CCA tRNA nucleotidyltransferase [Virgibacillus flavescens]|uniref:CCA tRNA nucleotidyltransferase n=1 Tax=Virgibacillus flavescens TaxID=1611422 RepID=UPI003D3283FE